MRSLEQLDAPAGRRVQPGVARTGRRCPRASRSPRTDSSMTLALVAGGQHEAPEALHGVDLHDVPDDRLAADLDQRLGDRLRALLQAGSPPAAQDHHGCVDCNLRHPAGIMATSRPWWSSLNGRGSRPGTTRSSFRAGRSHRGSSTCAPTCRPTGSPSGWTGCAPSRWARGTASGPSSSSAAGAEVVALDLDDERDLDWPPRRRPTAFPDEPRGKGFALASELLDSSVDRRQSLHLPRPHRRSSTGSSTSSSAARCSSTCATSCWRCSAWPS